MADLNAKILQEKFDAVCENLEDAIGNYTGWGGSDHPRFNARDTLSILQAPNLDCELGHLYGNIFTRQFSYHPEFESLFKKKADILSLSLIYGQGTLADHALYEMSKLDLLPEKKKFDYLKKAVFGSAGQETILNLVSMVPSELIKTYEIEAKNTLVAQARKRDLLDVVNALQEIIAYQPPAVSGVNPAKIKISFADPRAMVRAALDAESSGLALDVGSDILHTCTKFFDEVRKRSAQSLASGLEAGNGLQSLALQADEARKALKEISANPEKLRVPDGIMGKLTLAVRAIIPALDPHKKLDHDFGDAIDTTKRTFDLSKSVVKAYEDFANHYPQINGEIDNLVAALDEGIAEIDAKGEITPNLAELKTVFMAIAGNARTMSVITAQNLASVEMMKTTEVQFALSVMNTQTAFAAVATDMSLSLAHMKASVVPEIQQMAEREVISHMRRAEETLTGLRQLIDDRQNNIVSLMPTIRQRTLEAA